MAPLHRMIKIQLQIALLVVLRAMAGRGVVELHRRRIGGVDAVVHRGPAPVDGVAVASQIAELDAVDALGAALRTGIAHLAGGVPTIAMPIGAQVDATGTDLAIAQIAVEIGVGLIPERTRSGDTVFEAQGLRIARRRAPVAVAALVVVVEAFLDVQTGQIELEIAVRLPLQRRADTVALARLLEQRRVDRRRKHAGVVADHTGRKPGALHIVVAENFHAVAAQNALRMHHRGKHAQRLVLILPAIQRRCVRLAFVGTIVVAITHGAGERIAIQIERFARMHDHGAADGALVDARFGRLIDLHQADHFRRQRAVVERAAVRVVGVAAPAGRRNGLAIEQHAIERRVGSQDADLFALAELPVHGDAGQPRQRFGNIGIGKLADILGADRIDDRIGVAFDVERLAQAGLVTHHLDFVQGGDRGLVCGGVCCCAGAGCSCANAGRLATQARLAPPMSRRLTAALNDERRSGLTNADTGTQGDDANRRESSIAWTSSLMSDGNRLVAQRRATRVPCP